MRASEVYNEYGEVEKYFYGAEYLESSTAVSKNLIRLFIASFSKKKLKEHLVTLLANEQQVSGHGIKEKIELLISLFHDMKKFRRTDGFLKGLIQESKRLTSSEFATLYFFDKTENTLRPYDFDKGEVVNYTYNIGESKLFSVVNKGEKKPEGSNTTTPPGTPQPGET